MAVNPVVHENVTRNCLVALMEFFTRFQVERFGSVIQGLNGSYIARKVIRPPIQFAARDKWLEIYRSSSARKAMDPAIREKNPVELQWILPRISFHLAGTTYDASRRLSKTQTIRSNENMSTYSGVNAFTPAPYNLELEVSVISKTLDDQLQLMEQIIPFFSPTLNLDVRLFANRPAESVPFVLSTIIQDIPTDITENDDRFFTFTYSFIIKLNYYVQPRSSSMNAPVIILNGTEVPANNIGETGFWYFMGGVVNTNTASACDMVGTFFQKGSMAWKPIWSAPTSGDWIFKSGLPASADFNYTPCGEPITGGQWYGGNTPPPSGSEPYNLYYFDTSTGTAYRKFGSWVYDPDAPPPVSGDPIDTDYYYDSTLNMFYKRVYTFEVIKQGLSSAQRMILWTQTNIHMYNDYIAVTDEWLEEQQKIQRRFEYFQASAEVPNPYVDHLDGVGIDPVGVNIIE